MAALRRGHLQFAGVNGILTQHPAHSFDRRFRPMVDLTLGREERRVVMPVWARGRLGRVSLDLLVVPLLLLVAVALRLSDLNWDSGHMFHPDERYILMVTDGLRLPWPIDVDL